jgi:4-phospho-D-threonate 3-dehydrogenase / 4-phospho-D-erythronate 3-dehydrogenase
MRRVTKPVIGVTMGDPAGIGPEIVLKALLSDEVRSLCTAVVYGDVALMQRMVADLKLGAVVTPAERGGVGATTPGAVAVRQATGADLRAVRPGRVDAQAGKAAAECVIAAARAALAGEIDAVVTAPLNKEAMALGGYPYPGHTELLAEIAGTSRYGMLLVSGALRVVHVSTHVSLREAIDRVTAERILECIRLGDSACRDLGIARPRIAIAGLNPHAGEHGLFGREEIDVIAPAIETARAEGLDASGPHPPDTVFARTVSGEFDLVVAMYHDQGHIPIKLHGFDSGVNITVGLPLIRVSVDHGTAFDIAGQGVAREQSMIEAIRVAVRMAERKSAA